MKTASDYPCSVTYTSINFRHFLNIIKFRSGMVLSPPPVISTDCFVLDLEGTDPEASGLWGPLGLGVGRWMGSLLP